LKRITESVSELYETEFVIRFPYNLTFFHETAYVIRLVNVWNACQNPFHKKFRVIVSETENKFRFTSQTEKKASIKANLERRGTTTLGEKITGCS